MKTVKLTITTDLVLIDAISDYLVGVWDAAVEFEVESKEQHRVLSAIVEVADEMQYTALRDKLETVVIELAQIFTVTPPTIGSQELTEKDWSTQWRSRFKPLHLLDNLVIVPSWEDYQPKTGEHVIEMDPGMALGTGQHETTQMCMALIRLVQQRSTTHSMLDVGTGTGILAMGAACLGMKSVVGIDHDPEAVSAAQQNVINNSLVDLVSISPAVIDQVRGQFDLVVANIVHDVLLDLAEQLSEKTGTDGHLILSGLIEGSQVRSITATIESKGFQMVEKSTKGEWASLLFVKP